MWKKSKSLHPNVHSSFAETPQPLSRIWTHLGYWSAKIDDIFLWSPASDNPQTFICFLLTSSRHVLLTSFNLSFLSPSRILSTTFHIFLFTFIHFSKLFFLWARVCWPWPLFCLYVAHFAFLGDVWIRTLNAAVASRCATKLATLILVIMHTLPKTKINHKCAMCMYNFENMMFVGKWLTTV